MGDAGAAGGERSSARRAIVHVVTAEEASSCAYNIQDVVLPLPGSQIQYPEYRDAEEEGGEEGEGGHQVGRAHMLYRKKGGGKPILLTRNGPSISHTSVRVCGSSANKAHQLDP